jgi:predicted metal-binding membrane protein
MWLRVTDRKTERRVFLMVMGALVTLAWLVLWGWGQSPHGRYLSHHFLGEVSLDDGALFILVFLAGWTLMIVAMMLPTSLPLISLFRTVVRQRPDQMRLVSLVIAGYLSIWTLFGVMVYLGDWGLHLAVEQLAWLETNAWVIGAGTLVLAGLYQFTPLKYRCLDKCRSPLSFVMEHWRGSHESAQSFRLGLHHGIFCLGCCWSLMLLMFALGIGNIGWMLVLGAVMAIEKNMPWGRKLSAPLGVLLVAWGVIILLRLSWSPLALAF